MVILVMINILHPTQVYTGKYHAGHHIVPYLKTYGEPHQLNPTALFFQPGPPTKRKNDSLGGNAVNGLAQGQPRCCSDSLQKNSAIHSPMTKPRPGRLGEPGGT